MEKEKVNYLAIILAVCVVLTGILCFYLGTYFGEKDVVEKEKTTETNKDEDKKNEKNLLSDNEAISEGTKLYQYVVDTFLTGDNVIKTDDSGYISKEDDSRCNVGIGCIAIKNWNEIVNKFSSEYIIKLKTNEDLAKSLGLKIIDDKAYLIDGFADYTRPALQRLTIVNKAEDSILFNAIVKYEDSESEIPSPETKTEKFAIRLVNNNWVISDFNISND